MFKIGDRVRIARALLDKADLISIAIWMQAQVGKEGTTVIHHGFSPKTGAGVYEVELDDGSKLDWLGEKLEAE